MTDAQLMQESETKPAMVGHWCAYVVGPASGWDRTILGVVIYAAGGSLAYSHWGGPDKALARGDWSSDWMPLEFNPPPSWEAMKNRLESTGNAMSQARYEGGLPTTRWDEESGLSLYQLVSGS